MKVQRMFGERNLLLCGWSVGCPLKEMKTSNMGMQSSLLLHEMGSNYIFKCKEVLFNGPLFLPSQTDPLCPLCPLGPLPFPLFITWSRSYQKWLWDILSQESLVEWLHASQVYSVLVDKIIMLIDWLEEGEIRTHPQSPSPPSPHPHRAKSQILTVSTTSPTMAFSKTLVLYRCWGNLGRCSLISVILTTIVVMSLREEEPFRLHSMDRRYLGLVSKSRLLLTYRIPEETRGGGSIEAVGTTQAEYQGGLEPNARRGSSAVLGEIDLLPHLLCHLLHHLSVYFPSPTVSLLLLHLLSFSLLPSQQQLFLHLFMYYFIEILFKPIILTLCHMDL